ncbi:hypothetical protein ABZ619_43465 [Streptomyces sp. NPDC007851]|uniref:hypothetical protein n=1 Tax=Streptomyces sp. NPDC007851 TaxID=3155008 RepID=UPI003404DA5A
MRNEEEAEQQRMEAWVDDLTDDELEELQLGRGTSQSPRRARRVHLGGGRTRRLRVAPVSGGYPYGAFGTTQRDRWLSADGTQAPGLLLDGGSDHPLGRL